MSKLTEGIKQIQEYFKERFGVEVRIELDAAYHQPANRGILNRELAMYIGEQLAQELGVDTVHKLCGDMGEVKNKTLLLPVEFSARYPGEEYLSPEEERGMAREEAEESFLPV